MAREGVIKSILARWCSLEDNPARWWTKMTGKVWRRRHKEWTEVDGKFLTEELKISVVRFHEARDVESSPSTLRTGLQVEVTKDKIGSWEEVVRGWWTRLSNAADPADKIMAGGEFYGNPELFERLLDAIPEVKNLYHHRTNGMLQSFIKIVTNYPKHVGTIEAPSLARALLTKIAETQEAKEYAETAGQEAMKGLAGWQQMLMDALNAFGIR
ncbi:hypothetical protein HK097_007510 [Rhizophlyctis rosea]|uniref:Uncharacterized protein n=1 Tax=Rhizophlyctis rosea TaxID=64517 RepID=A0AAD5SEL0_9FUNG|nr:hypothetical protein HK097_007510 [Rhizophlyctis rosea]